MFVVPTIGFDLLYAFVIVRLDRGDLVWINVTTNPTAEWVARQITEAFPWDMAPRYMIRDRDLRFSIHTGLFPPEAAQEGVDCRIDPMTDLVVARFIAQHGSVQ